MQAETRVPAKITVNGRSQECRAGDTVADLLAALRLGTRGIAVEINRAVVPRADFEALVIQSGDEIEIVTLVGGG